MGAGRGRGEESCSSTAGAQSSPELQCHEPKATPVSTSLLFLYTDSAERGEEQKRTWIEPEPRFSAEQTQGVRTQAWQQTSTGAPRPGRWGTAWGQEARVLCCAGTRDPGRCLKQAPRDPKDATGSPPSTPKQGPQGALPGEHEPDSGKPLQARSGHTSLTLIAAGDTGAAHSPGRLPGGHHP